MTSKANDDVTLVTPDDQVIGSLDKFSAHKHPAQLHRAISVWLFRPSSGSDTVHSKPANSHSLSHSHLGRWEVLLQQRSSQKFTGAGWWANTVCGNVRPNESYSECAYRRLREEVGITEVDLKPLFAFQYQAYCNQEYGEHEQDQVFSGLYEGESQVNPAEAAQTAWFNLQILTDFAQVLNYPTAEQTLDMNLSELQAATYTPELTIGTFHLKLAPWTVLMLRDEKLLKHFA